MRPKTEYDEDVLEPSETFPVTSILLLENFGVMFKERPVTST
jgi:hypothetical protein